MVNLREDVSIFMMSVAKQQAKYRIDTKPFYA